MKRNGEGSRTSVGCYAAFGMVATMSNAGLCRIGCCQCCHYRIQRHFVRHNQTEVCVSGIVPRSGHVSKRYPTTREESVGDRGLRDALSLKRSISKVVRHFLTDTSERGVDFAGALQSSLNMRQDILASDVGDEVGFLK